MDLFNGFIHYSLPLFQNLPVSTAKSGVKRFANNFNYYLQRHTLALAASTFDIEMKNIPSMESKITDLYRHISKSVETEKGSSKMKTGKVFADWEGSYLNNFSLFLAHFNTIPNFIKETEIDCKKANNWFLDTYRSEIKDMHFDKIYNKESKRAEYDVIFYVLFDDLIVNFDINQSVVGFLFRRTEMKTVEAVINGIRKFKGGTNQRPAISVVVNTYDCINTKALKILKPKLDLGDNYNDDFKDIHQIIVKRLSKKNDSGLVLLHGKPGTGKTSYIRYLILAIKKNVIFLPPNLAGAVTNEDFISFLISNRNSILVIEDAENIIVDRENERRSPVSALLNISDGLLADCLKIQVICSFNTDITKIDTALMRKGRLIAKYEFKELEVRKANALSQKLGFNTNFNSPMTLADIYNQQEKGFQQIKRHNAIGFNVVDAN